MTDKHVLILFAGKELMPTSTVCLNLLYTELVNVLQLLFDQSLSMDPHLGEPTRKNPHGALGASRPAQDNRAVRAGFTLYLMYT